MTELAKASSSKFNPFKLAKITAGEELVTLVMYLFGKHEWGGSVGGLEESVLYNFMKQIQDGYRANPYHNKTHATDVTQTVYYLCTRCEF